MKQALTIAGKEIRSSFVTPMAYVVISGFLVLSGFFFFELVGDFNDLLKNMQLQKNVIDTSLNFRVIAPYFQILAFVLVFLVPILTMRAISEEKRSGTFELLATSPITVSDLVLGKFLGSAFVIWVMLSLSFIFPAALIAVSDPEVAPVFVGFGGLLLFGLAFISIGIAVSATTKNQTIAGVASAIISLVFFLCDLASDYFGALGGAIVRYLSPSVHAESMLRGVVTGADLVYFASVIFLGLFVANRVLDAERWR